MVVLASELAADEAVQAADIAMLTVPNQLGATYNIKMLESIVPAIG